MEIQPLGRHNLLIYLDGDEVRDLPAPPHELKTDDAAVILRQALGENCDDDWENVYLELFAGPSSLLLIARAHSGDPCFFEFQNIEELIEAASVCTEDVISFLLYCEGAYYLIVYPWERENPPGTLYEYGRELTMHPNYAFHLTEHGRLLMGPTALAELRSRF